MRRYSPNFVAGIIWKLWPGSNGITGRDQMEWVAGMEWNHWPGSNGILSWAVNDHIFK
jgi:hypothetical protein